MKKILQNVLFVLIVAFGFMLVSTNVYAEEVGEITPPIQGFLQDMIIYYYYFH